MTIEKSNLKALIARNFAQEMRVAGEKASQGIHNAKGAAEAFQITEKKINEQSQVTKQKLIDGKVDVDLTNPVELAKFIVGEMMAITKHIHELGNNALLSSIRAEGEVRAYQEAEKQHLRVFAEEQAKVEAYQQAVLDAAHGEIVGVEGEQSVPSNGRPAPRAPGTHPGPPMKGRREAEAAAAAKGSKATEAAAAEKPKRGRPRKTRSSNPTASARSATKRSVRKSTEAGPRPGPVAQTEIPPTPTSNANPEGGGNATDSRQ